MIKVPYFMIEKHFLNDDFILEYNKIYDSIFNLGETVIKTTVGPITEIILLHIPEGIGSVRIIRDIPNTLLCQGFNELVDLILSILPSGWIIPRFCQM